MPAFAVTLRRKCLCCRCLHEVNASRPAAVPGWPVIRACCACCSIVMLGWASNPTLELQRAARSERLCRSVQGLLEAKMPCKRRETATGQWACFDDRFVRIWMSLLFPQDGRCQEPVPCLFCSPTQQHISSRPLELSCNRRDHAPLDVWTIAAAVQFPISAVLHQNARANHMNQAVRLSPTSTTLPWRLRFCRQPAPGHQHHMPSFSRVHTERSLLYTLPGGEPKIRLQMASRATRMLCGTRTTYQTSQSTEINLSKDMKAAVAAVEA